MLETNGNIYAFDGFQIDRQKRLLLREGRPVQLTAKCFDLLLTLVESSGREISKDELLERIWPGQVVEEGNLTVTMSHLRKALGEKASEHRFIVTIPGRGYCFVGDLLPPSAKGELIIESRTASQIVIEEETIPEVVRSQTSLPADASDWSGTVPVAPLKQSQARTLALQSHARAPALPSRTWLIAPIAAIALTGLILGYFALFRRATPAASPQVKTIAVLPFKPLVTENRDESLEMGMADTLIARLSNLREIDVRPISAVRKYTSLEQDPVSAGREQRVDAVVDGQIQKTGDKIRVTVRLFRVTDGAAIWTSQFDEKMTDIFAVQDSISERVAAALAIKLTSEEQRGLTKRHTDDLEAYQLYLKGRYHLNRLTDDGFFKGRDYFQQAIGKDRNYALAYAGLAEAYNMLGNMNALSSKESFPKAREAAEMALKLDENLVEAHNALGVVKFSYDWDFPAAEQQFRRALEIDPGSSQAYEMYAYYLAAMGKFDVALKEMTRAHELDPLSLGKVAGIGDILYLARRYDQSLEQYRKALDMDPNSGFAHWALGRSFNALGKHDEAIAELQKAIPLSGDSPDEPAELARAYALAGKRKEALKIVEELKRLSARKYVSPCVMAAIYGALGDRTEAFALLEKAFTERDFLLILLNTEPMFDSLRSDARFAELARRVGLPR